MTLPREPILVPTCGGDHRVQLEAGLLTLRIAHAALPVEELCGFASRRNRKRGFLFVSKVLGKHYPVRPSVMEDVHIRLAALLEHVRTPAVVIGLAETATGLAHGVYEHLFRQSVRQDWLFLHSTRYRLRRPLALEFREPHSHAPRHFLHQPADADHCRLLEQATSLILVDDELSTGVTLANLSRAYRETHPRLRTVHVVSIANWLLPQREQEFAAAAGVETRFYNLLRGEFQFQPSADYRPEAAPEAPDADRYLDKRLPANFGRLGIQGLLQLPDAAAPWAEHLQRGDRVLVLGTGEFNYAPFRLARVLEERGLDVRFQSTTRSPILLGGAIASVLTFPDNYEEAIPNFLYNVANRQYDRIIIGYETIPLPPSHDLPRQLNGHPVFFTETPPYVASLA